MHRCPSCEEVIMSDKPKCIHCGASQPSHLLDTVHSESRRESTYERLRREREGRRKKRTEDEAKVDAAWRQHYQNRADEIAKTAARETDASRPQRTESTQKTEAQPLRPEQKESSLERSRREREERRQQRLAAEAKSDKAYQERHQYDENDHSSHSHKRYEQSKRDASFDVETEITETELLKTRKDETDPFATVNQIISSRLQQDSRERETRERSSASPRPTTSQTRTQASATPKPLLKGSKGVYIFLGLFFGLLGFHNFYAGQTGRGVVKLLLTILFFWTGVTIIATYIWILAEIATSKFIPDQST